MLGPPPTAAEHAQAWMGFRSTTLLGGLASLVLGALYFFVGAHEAGVVTAVFGLVLFGLRVAVPARHVEAGLLLVVTTSLMSFVAVARDLGGLSSPPVVWLPLVLRATYLAVGPRIGVPSAVLTAVAVAVVPFVSHEPVVSPATLEYMRMASVAVALASALVGAENHEKSRKHALALVEEASRVKSDLLATVSHELRTPLHAVVGMSELLLDSTLDAAQREHAVTLRGAAENLVTLVDDLLETSRLDAGRVVLQPAPCDLGNVAGAVVDLLAVRAEQKGLTLTLDVAPDLPAVVVDCVRVRQVLTNLVDNAVKFTPAGSVSVRVHADLDDAVHVRFVVEDTGIGIPADKHEVIFERFTQADSSASRRYGGTGLGLAIARDLLQLMGGTIEVRSEPGAGSTFTASFTAPRAPPPPSLDGTRVLLAEDNEVNQRLAVHLLKSLGCFVDVAQNGSEAVRMARALRYDVILMDCHMPEMDGYRAAAAIRAHAGAGLPILALTAAGSPEDVRRAQEAGMDALLQKPIDVEGIRASLGRVVHQINAK